mgnify:CR=1 FL=1|jgi:fluoride ion exporter CrcB/FEX
MSLLGLINHLRRQTTFVNNRSKATVEPIQPHPLKQKRGKNFFYRFLSINSVAKAIAIMMATAAPIVYSSNGGITTFVVVGVCGVLCSAPTTMAVDAPELP